jgi:hypothetical protein
MLHVITSLNDPLVDLVRDDPVRPEIPKSLRIHDNAQIFVLLDEAGQASAVTCVSYCDTVPESVSNLWANAKPSVAAFYTIWSYAPGAGRRLIREAQQYIKTNNTGVKRYVTLSPKTDMARVFHHRNGAVTLRENADTVNYEYLDSIGQVAQQLA